MKINLIPNNYKVVDFYEEIWKPVITDEEDYTGLYEVSNIGRVRSLDREVKVNNSKQPTKMVKGQIMTPYKDNDGYLEVGFYKDGKYRRIKIHRLVAFAFIPNPENKPHVDHINTIRDDNRAVNLRWCTPKENSNNELTLKHFSEAQKGEKHPMYGKHHTEEARKKMSEARKGENNPFFGKHHSEETKSKISEAKNKKVICIETGQVFNSLQEVEENMGVCSTSITKCCRGRQKTAGGFHWKYYEEEVEANEEFKEA